MSRSSLDRVVLFSFLALSSTSIACSGSDSGGEGAAGNNGTGGVGGSTGVAGSVAGSPGHGGSGPGGSSGVAGSGPAGSGGGPTGVAGGSAGSGHGGSGPGGSGAGSGGSGPAGSGGSVAGHGGGAAGSGPAGSGGRGGTAGGAAGSGAGGGGVAGSSGGKRAYTCPAGPFTSPTSSTLASPMKVTGVPIFDTFNNDGNNNGNIEGPVWIESEGALFFSEIGGGNNPPPSRVYKVTAAGAVSIAITDSGSNGLAVDGMGRLFAANHKTGSISILSLTGGAAMPVVSTYMNARFDSPNDLAIRSDGTIYFSDPDWQAPSNPRPQTKTRLYKVAPGSSTAEVIDENRQEPNGVTLSLDETTLFVSSGAGIFKYPIDPNTGAVGAGTQWVNSISSGDGMVMDCAGNLYIAANSNSALMVVSPAGTVIAMVSQTGITNVAFGGTDHKTLYLTAMGTAKNGPMGLYKIAMPLPGMPY
jgi:gluconolactonase